MMFRRTFLSRTLVTDNHLEKFFIVNDGERQIQLLQRIFAAESPARCLKTQVQVRRFRVSELSMLREFQK